MFLYSVIKRHYPLWALSAVLLTPAISQACASCGCTLSADWESLGISSTSGLKLDLRYDYLNQNQLRSGTHAISSTAASQASSKDEPQEVERYTKNNYFTADMDYSFNRAWAVNVQLPYIFRSHDTLGTASDGHTTGDDGGQYRSNTANIGDVKLIGRYQGFNDEHNIGLLFGIKLPTGSHTETGTSTDPTAPDAVAIDRGLQPGTGTTDLIVGAYYLDALSKDWSYFAQGIFQTAANSRDHFRPGDGINLNVGIRYMSFTDFTPQLQLNTRLVERDSGANADTVSTGGTLIYLSPGVAVPIDKKISLYGFVQLPIYQNVNGVQLAPRYTASIGAHFSF